MPLTLNAQVMETTLKEESNSETTQETIVERKRDPYVVEREIIIHQLDIITGDEEVRYIIVSGDTLTISYQDRSEIKKAVYKVSSAGEIHMPLVGAVKVSELNRKQAREKINRLMKEYIRYPKVQIAVNVSGRFMVAGEVNDPGVYRIRSNLTVMEAILQADYDKDKAKLKSIILMRGIHDDPVVSRLNLYKMIKEGDRSDNVFVKPGDFIYVPRTFISNLEKFNETILRWVQAYFGLRLIPETRY